MSEVPSAAILAAVVFDLIVILFFAHAQPCCTSEFFCFVGYLRATEFLNVERQPMWRSHVRPIESNGRRGECYFRVVGTVFAALALYVLHWMHLVSINHQSPEHARDFFELCFLRVRPHVIHEARCVMMVMLAQRVNGFRFGFVD